MHYALRDLLGCSTLSSRYPTEAQATRARQMGDFLQQNPEDAQSLLFLRGQVVTLPPQEEGGKWGRSDIYLITHLCRLSGETKILRRNENTYNAGPYTILHSLLEGLAPRRTVLIQPRPRMQVLVHAKRVRVVDGHQVGLREAMIGRLGGFGKCDGFVGRGAGQPYCRLEAGFKVGLGV